MLNRPYHPIQMRKYSKRRRHEEAPEERPVIAGTGRRQRDELAQREERNEREEQNGSERAGRDRDTEDEPHHPPGADAGIDVVHRGPVRCSLT